MGEARTRRMGLPGQAANRAASRARAAVAVVGGGAAASTEGKARRDRAVGDNPASRGASRQRKAGRVSKGVTMVRKIAVTSALPYANGPIHMGHLVEYIQTDIWVRFQKLCGNRCLYFCADDTHGTAIMIRAKKEGITPQELINRVHAEHYRDFKAFSIEFDNYYTTHSEENRRFSEEIYSKLAARGSITKKDVEQAFCEKCGMFLPDRFIKGGCPRCKFMRCVRRDSPADGAYRPEVCQLRLTAREKKKHALLLQARGFRG
jgi:methionyl-tRNA synthetase